MEASCVFAPAVSQEEWASIPTEIAKKLETFATEKFNELITCKALLETTRFTAEKAVKEAQTIAKMQTCLNMLKVELLLTELTQANEHNMDLLFDLTTRYKKCAEALFNQRNAEARSYLHLIEVVTKLEYNSMFDESHQHSEELKEALADKIQKLLKHATQKYGNLETKHQEAALTYKEMVAAKNECITMLKKELEVLKQQRHQS